MQRLLILALVTLGLIIPSCSQGAARPRLSAPYLLMYGYSDPDAVHYSGFWLQREQWERAWQSVLARFTIITGRTTDAALVKRLREQGKVFAYHVSNTLDAQHQTADDLVREWSRPFDDTLDGELPGGFDAISIDELHSYADGSKESGITIAALRELRRRYPGKLILAWAVWKLGLGGSPGSYGTRYAAGQLFDRQLQAVADCCDLLMLECYQREGNPQLSLFTEIAKNVETRVPGLLRKTVFGLGIAQSPNLNYDDRPDVDFAEFLEKQFELLRDDPLLRQTNGVAFFAFYRAKPELIPTINSLVAKYYPLPKAKP